MKRRAAKPHEPRRRARRRALQALYQWQLTGQEAASIVAQFREEQDFDGVDEAFFEAIVRGVAAELDTLDERIAPCLDRPLAQVDAIERAVLRMGAWEMLHELQTPMRVVLDECIDLARRFGAEGGHGYVNGVLDKAAETLRPHEASGA